MIKEKVIKNNQKQKSKGTRYDRLINNISIHSNCSNVFNYWNCSSIIALVVIGFLGWTLIGSLLTTKRTYEVISKENIEILAGAERIIVTETKLNITEVFKNAKTYNDITIKGDSTFKIGRKFNMYNYEIGTYITR